MIQCEAFAQTDTISIAVPPGMEGHRLKIIIIDEEAERCSTSTVEAMRLELAGLVTPFEKTWSREDINER